MLSRRFALEVRISFQASDIVGDKRIRLLSGYARCRGDFSAECGEQVLRPKLNVREHFRNRITVYELSHLVSIL
jgi:hypothetical protein